MRTKSPDKRCRQKLKPRIRDVNPETALEYFQISVNVLEGRKLAWASSHATNSYVVVMLGKEKHRTSIKKNMQEPCYKEYFLFEWYANIREIQRTSLWLAVMEPKCCSAPHLLGETSIDLEAIWAQPNHQVFHKWAQLSLPREPEAGAVGFLKVDISIVCRGDLQTMPMIVNQDRMEGHMPPSVSRSEQQTANYLVTVYGANGLHVGPQDQGDRRYGKLPSTYVKVSFSGLSGKTAIQYRNCNPSFCEQICIVEAFPNICQVIRFEVCLAEPCLNNLLGSVDLRLGLVSHDGENGFVPVFGPSLLHMYGNVSSGLGASGEDGPYHNGSLLVALKTLVPYYKQGMRTSTVEPSVPILTMELWNCEDFCILCPILEVSMLDKRLVGKCSGVAISVAEMPCEYKCDRDFTLLMNEIKSRKLHYTGSLNVVKTSPQYGYLDFSNAFPVLQLATRFPDFRFRVFMNNMVRAIATDLDNALAVVDKKLAYAEYVAISDLVDELGNAVDVAAAGMRKFLETEVYIDEKPGSSRSDFKSYKTELDHKQLTLQKTEIEKMYHQIMKKSGNSSMNLTRLVSRTSRDSYTITKKELKSILAEAKTISQRINNLIFGSPEGWPDIVLWLLNGVTRVAYCKISLADAIYSVIPEQCGRYCGRIQTVYLKPLKCPKHFNTLPPCSCVAGKVELVTWMGLFEQAPTFDSCLPKTYKLKTNDYDMSLKTSMMMLQCRFFISAAKINVCADNSSPPSPFIRVHALNSLKETMVEQQTANPVWNVVLLIQKLTFIPPSRLKAVPPSVVVEVYDTDESGKAEFVGRTEIRPVVDERDNYQYAPRLQWYEIHRGLEMTGQILMSVQLLQVPETLVKSTIYTSVDESYDRPKDIGEDTSVEQLPLCLMPKTNTYKVDVYWWGLRDISITKKPCAVLEIDELQIKSDIISEHKSNCNFPNGRSSHIFKAPLNELYCPPLNIRLCDSSTFGRTLFMGTNVVKNPNKYLVDWLPKYVREESLRSVSIMSSNFLRVSDTLFIKNSDTSNEESSDSKITISSGLLPAPNKQPAWRKLFCRKEPNEEEFLLLPAFTKGKELTKENENIPVPEHEDWWVRYFASLKGRTIRNTSSGKIKIYHSELESQPEFQKFKDWCKTLKLYSGTKTGVGERDAKLRCGFLKAAIAIYKWPPPSNTVAVNASGVDLVQGYFDDHPANDPTTFLVRVYIIRGMILKPHSFTGNSDPYVVINCGNKHSEDNNRHTSHSLNPVFGKMYEFQCCLPEDYLLTVSLYDHEALSPDDLIGSTTIDLENRIYSRHRARVGIASDYKVTGPAKWRDCMKPSAILEEVCRKNHLPPPIYLDNNTVIVNEVQYKDADKSNKTFISASECKENICLEVLNKWQTLPLCGYQLVPEHVETRSLLNADKPGIEQGKIQMWVDIFPLDTSIYIPLPVDITPRKVQDYELRVTIWSVQNLRAVAITDNKRRDICVKAWIGSEENVQYTDIHYQSINGECSFNWRMVFHFQYQHEDKTMILKEKGPFTEVEEHLAPMLILQVIDCETVSNEYLGTLTLDLNFIPKGPKRVNECKLNTLDDLRRINLFSIKNIRGWWPLKIIDANTGIPKFAGAIDLEISLMPKEMAILLPVGIGRDPPLPLPEPNRLGQYQDITKPILETIFQNGAEYFVIGVILLATFAVGFYWGFPNIFIGTLFG